MIKESSARALLSVPTSDELHEMERRRKTTEMFEIERSERKRKMISAKYNEIGIPVEEVGKKIKELNEILKEHNMALKAENEVKICFWKDENTAISLKLEVVLLSDDKDKEKKEELEEKKNG